MTRSQAQESARKVCSPNRDLYHLQSAMTRGGRVPTIDEVRAAQQTHNAGRPARES